MTGSCSRGPAQRLRLIPFSSAASAASRLRAVRAAPSRRPPPPMARPSGPRRRGEVRHVHGPSLVGLQRSMLSQRSAIRLAGQLAGLACPVSGTGAVPRSSGRGRRCHLHERSRHLTRRGSDAPTGAARSDGDRPASRPGCPRRKRAAPRRGRRSVAAPRAAAEPDSPATPARPHRPRSDEPEHRSLRACSRGYAAAETASDVLPRRRQRSSGRRVATQHRVDGSSTSRGPAPARDPGSRSRRRTSRAVRSGTLFWSGAAG